MIGIYYIGIQIYYFLILSASLFNPKARLWIKGRKKLFKRIASQINPGEKTVWFHCASLGEFEQGRPLIEAFKKNYPEYKILLTFYSPSGYEIRKNYEHADYIFYLPLDTPGNASEFLDIVSPELIFFIKYEFWYFFLVEINKRKIPLYLVSGIFRKEQRFFKPYGKRSKRMLGCFNHFFVQNQQSKKLLHSINLSNVTVTGDTRFDRVYTIAKESKNLALIDKFKNNEEILIAGSSWKPDEEIIIKYFNQTSHQFKLIVAPHEVHSENIDRIVNLFGANKNVVKYSEANIDHIENADVLIIDCIGLLSSLYKYGEIAFIGGGFGKGIHNILEAATFGLPIIVGPNYQKFQEAVDLIQLGGATCVHNYQDIENILNQLFNDQAILGKKGQIAAEFVEQKRGATDKILNTIEIQNF
ncbi:MAG: glycosyltransferase N-terminal domain-containing protein [Bacteroidales bacterium]